MHETLPHVHGRAPCAMHLCRKTHGLIPIESLRARSHICLALRPFRGAPESAENQVQITMTIRHICRTKTMLPGPHFGSEKVYNLPLPCSNLQSKSERYGETLTLSGHSYSKNSVQLLQVHQESNRSGKTRDVSLFSPLGRVAVVGKLAPSL